MSMTVPAHLRYTLSRPQRLVPHLRMWGIGDSLFVVALFGFFAVRAVVGVYQLEGADVLVFGGLSLAVLWLFRGLFVGLIDALVVPVRSLDVTIEDNALGILLGCERSIVPAAAQILHHRTG
jgi:hypothetical protein